MNVEVYACVCILDKRLRMNCGHVCIVCPRECDKTEWNSLTICPGHEHGLPVASHGVGTGGRMLFVVHFISFL